MAVSSALVGLTSLFGMGRGEHHRDSHQKLFSIIRHIRERKYIDKSKNEDQ